MWLVELTADYRGRHGRIVTDQERLTVPTLQAAIQATAQRWQIVGRRHGTQLHSRYTSDEGQTITRTHRRP